MFRFTKQPYLYSFILLTTIAWLSSCHTAWYFATPDYFTRQPGILVLKNGENIPGQISVNNLMGNTVTILPFPNGEKQVYTVNEVVSCKLEIGVFGPMSIVREFPNLSTRLTFMEKLTPDSFSISLYQGYERLTDPNLMGDVTLQEGFEYDLWYYVHLPGDERKTVR